MLPFLVDFSRTTTIHGFSQLVSEERHPVERVGWACMIAVAVGCTVAVSLETLHRYNENPTVISMERNYAVWNISLPATFICPTDKIDQRRLDELSKRLAGQGLNQEKVDIIASYLATLLNTTYDNLGQLQPFAKYSFLPRSDVTALLWEVKANFTCQMTSSGWDTRLRSLNKSDVMLVEKGFCFAHNSLLSPDWSTPRDKARARLAHALSNQELVVSKLDGARVISIFEISSSYDAYWMSRDEVPEAGGRPAAPNVDMRSQFSAKLRVVMALTASTRVRELSPERRRCLFADEAPHDAAFNVYSFKTCLVECRVRRAVQLCACAPYFARRNSSSRECDIHGLLCLAKHTDTLVRLDVDGCGCRPSCEVTAYSLLGRDVIGSTEFGRRMAWVITEFPKTRYKRDVMFTFSDLLVAFGGTAGLFLGCSLLSLLEIVYFFTLRLTAFFVRRRTSS